MSCGVIWDLRTTIKYLTCSSVHDIVRTNCTSFSLHVFLSTSLSLSVFLSYVSLSLSLNLPPADPPSLSISYCLSFYSFIVRFPTNDTKLIIYINFKVGTTSELPLIAITNVRVRVRKRVRVKDFMGGNSEIW